MKQFFTKNTVEAAVWCKSCGKLTQWKISGGRPQHCLVCMGKLEAESRQRKKEPQVKQGGFDFNG